MCIERVLYGLACRLGRQGDTCEGQFLPGDGDLQ